MAGEILRAARISDPRLSRIVSEFCSASRTGREYDLAGFISGFEEPADAALITDMQVAGERRGNYEATLRGAMERLQQEQTCASETATTSQVEETVATRLSRVQKTSEQHRFAGSGRRLPDLVGRDVDEPAMGTIAEGDG
jgi:hypothetical protein